MYTPAILKKAILSIIFTTVSFIAPFSYADAIPDLSTQNLVAGFGSLAIDKKLMNTAPENNALTVSTDQAQAIYLDPANSPFIGKLTQKLLTKIANLGNATNQNYSLTWTPNTKSDSAVEKEPLKSVDVNSILAPITYSNIENSQAKNVIDALGGTLLPMDTVNFDQLVSNLSGDKNKNIKAKLNEKQTQAYLAALRGYMATQTLALGNLYQLYGERQAIDPNTLSSDLKAALKAVTSKTANNTASMLQLENFMATRRITDKNWNLNLIKENPATLQREQTQLMAESLAETYQTRMTLERLLATMSVLVLEINQQIRTQLQGQIQNITNPPKK